MKTFATCFAIISLTGCAVGPDYHAPNEHMPDTYSSAEARDNMNGAEREPRAIQMDWWNSFGDENLTAIIEMAFEQNLDMQIAAQRVLESRAGVTQARSDFFPKISIGATTSRSSVAPNSASPLVPLAAMSGRDLTVNSYEFGFNSNWEIDLFGGIQRSVEASHAKLQATAENYHLVTLVMASEIGMRYFQLRGLQKRLDITNKNIDILTNTLKLVENKYKTGLVPELDVARARANLAGAKSRLPDLSAQINQSIFRLSVIVGRSPNYLMPLLKEHRPLPKLPKSIGIGEPSDLLITRPDIRMAERGLSAYSAEIGVVTSQLYPKLSISGLLGLSSLTAGDLVSSESETWSISGGVQWPIFRMGEIRAGIDEATARFDGAYLHYRNTVLNALQDVESNLTSFHNERRRFFELQQTVDSTVRSVELSNILYDKGLAEFLNVLDVERSLVEIEDLHAQSETLQFIKLVALHKSLGSGWQLHTNSSVILASNAGVGGAE